MTLHSLSTTLIDAGQPHVVGQFASSPLVVCSVHCRCRGERCTLHTVAMTTRICRVRS